MRRPVFLDVDNTLLDNDAAKAALAERLAAAVGAATAARFWTLYERIRDAADHVDLPATVVALGAEDPAAGARAGAVLAALPYADFVYPDALAVIARLWDHWVPAILSDGDADFQPRKIARAGLAAAVHGNVLVFEHKEEHLGAARARFPGERPVFVDDRADLLGHIAHALPDAVTVHVRQGGHAALRPAAGEPAPAHTIARIGDLEGLLPLL
jgi:FMN phosphatase YigB (HAD superfamily)